MSTEKILLIGGAGLLGSRVAYFLGTQGHEIAIFDSLQQFNDPQNHDYRTAFTFRKSFLADLPYQVINGDASELADILHALEKFHPSRIVHLAAIPTSRMTDQHISNAVKYSIQSIADILQVASYFDIKRFLYVSSSLVYGDFQYSPCDEQHPYNPRTIYGSIKLSSELLTRAIAEKFHIPHTIVRPISLYGPSDLNGLLSAHNIRRILESKVFPVASREIATDWTYVDDTAIGLSQALMQDGGANQTFNISHGKSHTLVDIIDAFKTLGYNITAGRVPGRPVADVPQRGALSHQKATDLLNFTPTVDLEEGLASCIKYVHDFHR